MNRHLTYSTLKRIIKHYKTTCTYQNQSRWFSHESSHQIPKNSEVKGGDDGSNPGEKTQRSQPGSSNFGPISYFSLALTGLVGSGLVVFYYIEKDKRGDRLNSKPIVTTGKAALGGSWSLVNQDGIPTTSADFLGKFTLLYFGFTHCPDICPNELVKVGKIITEVSKFNHQSKIIPVFISVDPLRDTVGQLKTYSQDFHKDMVFLTGTQDQVANASRKFRVYFSKANENLGDEGDEEYLVDHSIVLYLISPEGEFLDFFTQRMMVSDVVEKISQRMKDHAS